MYSPQEKTIGQVKFIGNFVDRMAFLGNIQRHLKDTPGATPQMILGAVALGEKIQKHWFKDAKECERLAGEMAKLLELPLEIELVNASN